MRLVLQRKWLSLKSTIGELSVDGKLLCFTLEDVVRPGPKIFGQTAVPAGTYQVIIDFSNRFNRLMPHILDVPGFTGIRIHPGNTAENTEGCILLGRTMRPDWIGSSRPAFLEFYGLLEAAKAANDPVTLTILKPI